MAQDVADVTNELEPLQRGDLKSSGVCGRHEGDYRMRYGRKQQRPPRGICGRAVALPSGAQRARVAGTTGVDENAVCRAPQQRRAELRAGQILSQLGAPLDNNIVERALKKAILNRRNELYQTLNGAAVGDLFISLIHTCELNRENPFDYLTNVPRHMDELKQKPSEWLPWIYRDSLPRTIAA
jgi:hypothetical protein